MNARKINIFFLIKEPKTQNPSIADYKIWENIALFKEVSLLSPHEIQTQYP